MGIFRRKEEPPTLPRSSTLPELPHSSYSSNRGEEEPAVSELPSLPGSARNNHLNEDMIKSAMDDHPEEDEVMDEETHHSVEAHRSAMPPSFLQRNTDMKGMYGVKSSARPERDTIFVKIDEFNRAQDSLAAIEETVKNIAADVHALRDIKLKEVEELNAWDEELKKVAARLAKIDSSVFGEA